MRTIFITTCSTGSMVPNLLLLFSFIFSIILPSSFSYEPRNHEVEALISIKSDLNDPHGVLNNWDEDSVDPCSWAMITCSADNFVIGLGAPSQSLSGTLSWRIANLTNLKQVLLQNNNISGKIPAELGMLSKLQTLDLSNNSFSGTVPESLVTLNSLRYLRLNSNLLSGTFPMPSPKITQLAFLDLSYNNFSGPMPKFPARTFNFVGNPLICGSNTTEGCSGSVTIVPLSFSLNPSSGKPKSMKVAIAIGVSLGTVTLIVVSMGFIFWQRKKQISQIILNISDKPEEDLISLGNLQCFTLRELQIATNNFSSKNILGSGGFGNVYKGKLGDGSIVAVKRLKDVLGTAGEWQFRTELGMISLAVHRNLLRLIGYCSTSKERLLVYPYMSNGSVASRLRAKPALDWNTRKRIALGAARGLVYLHEQCDPKILHRDVKAANVLLDDCCEAVVGDFGLAKLLDHAESHVTTAVRGTVGHIAPEYLSTGQSSEKTDVFGFGILLLELISGMRALTVNQKGAMLEWVRKIHLERKVEMLVDKEIDFDRIEVCEMLQIALLCTQYLPAHRPKMAQVVTMLQGDGLPEKWAATHNFNTNLFSCPSMVVKPDDSTSMFGLMEEDHHHSLNSHAMELSGPR